MSNQPEPRPDPALDLRVSHEDRDRVVEVLRAAAGDGRLDIDELEERMEKALAAKTFRELQPLTADLPVAGTPQPAPQSVPQPAASSLPGTRIGGAPTSSRSQAILSEAKRTGVWVVPGRYHATTVLGSVDLDLREASFAEREVEIQCNAVLGEIRIQVAEDVTVVDEVSTILGEVKFKARRRPDRQPDPNGPVVRLTGTTFLGSVNVYRLPAGQSRLTMRWK